MKELTFQEQLCVSGGETACTTLGAAGGIIGGAVVFPFALLLGLFAMDSPYSSTQAGMEIMGAIIGIGSVAGGVIGAGIGASIDYLHSSS